MRLFHLIVMALLYGSSVQPILVFAEAPQQGGVAGLNINGQNVYVSWPFPVAVSRDASKAVAHAAESLRRILSVKQEVLTYVSGQEIGCCFNVRLAGGAASHQGYVVIINVDFAEIVATNEEQLKRAIDQIKSVARVSGTTTEIPIGVMTNYDVNKSARAH